MIHNLKTLPCFFRATLAGDKLFEIRDNRDRGFQKGDTVILKEWVPGVMQGSFTGCEIAGKITYVCDYAQKEGYVVFGFEVDES
jgi:hypothetical protein